jgi:hypothetical protein
LFFDPLLQRSKIRKNRNEKRRFSYFGEECSGDLFQVTLSHGDHSYSDWTAKGEAPEERMGGAVRTYGTHLYCLVNYSQ